MNTRESIDIEQLVADHAGELLAYASARVKDRADAEDLIQNTFMAAFQGLDNYKGDSSARTWLFSILRHKIMDHYRKYYRGADRVVSADEYFTEDGSWKPEEAPSDWNDEQHLLDNKGFNDALMNCRKGLPGNLYAVVQMKYYEKLDAELICKELGISSTNYWQLMHRAKLKLRDCLQQTWFNE